jgi:hypothetical protein
MMDMCARRSDLTQFKLTGAQCHTDAMVGVSSANLEDGPKAYGDDNPAWLNFCESIYRWRMNK